MTRLFVSLPPPLALLTTIFITGCIIPSAYSFSSFDTLSIKHTTAPQSFLNAPPRRNSPVWHAHSQQHDSTPTNSFISDPIPCYHPNHPFFPLHQPATTLLTSFVILWSAILTIPTPAAATPPPLLPNSIVTDRVERVVDGDTVILSTLGRVRLIGMNTPETVSPAQREQGQPPQCYGPEASSFTKSFLPPNTAVKVELDTEPTDKYGRVLGYVYRKEDGMFVNGVLVEKGYARAKTYGSNKKYEGVLKDYERGAKAAKRGLWGVCSAEEGKVPYFATPVATTAGGGAGAGVKGGNGLQNPGDTKNCADFGTFEEAKAWYDKYFPLYGDVAKLDGDGDGIPCEGLLKNKKK